MMLNLRGTPSLEAQPTSEEKPPVQKRRSRRSSLGGYGYELVIASGILVVGLALTGCGRQKSAGGAPGGPEVSVIIVKPQTITLTTELPGRASAFLVADIRPQVNGLVQKRLFTEGSDVEAGQELYQIDPAPFQAALDNAKAALGRSKANLPALGLRADRFKKALVDKAVSQQDFDDADAALNQAEADVRYWEAMLETARINLEYSRIVSPISGRIGKSTVTDGAIVTAYQPMPLATIQQLDPIYIDVPQSTTSLLELERHLRARQINRDGTNVNSVQLILGNGAPYSHDGTLEFRDISVDPTTGSVILRMVFPNPDGVLLPGMFVRAIVQEGVNDHAILIPQRAVSRDPKGNPLVLIVGVGNKVEQRPVCLDRAIGTQWLVSSGLEPEDRVIVEGVQKVRPGSEVRTIPFEVPVAN